MKYYLYKLPEKQGYTSTIMWVHDSDARMLPQLPEEELSSDEKELLERMRRKIEDNNLENYNHIPLTALNSNLRQAIDSLNNPQSPYYNKVITPFSYPPASLNFEYRNSWGVMIYGNSDYPVHELTSADVRQLEVLQIVDIEIVQ